MKNTNFKCIDYTLDEGGGNGSSDGSGGNGGSGGSAGLTASDAPTDAKIPWIPCCDTTRTVKGSGDDDSSGGGDALGPAGDSHVARVALCALGDEPPSDTEAERARLSSATGGDDADVGDKLGRRPAGGELLLTHSLLATAAATAAAAAAARAAATDIEIASCDAAATAASASCRMPAGAANETDARR